MKNNRVVLSLMSLLILVLVNWPMTCIGVGWRQIGSDIDGEEQGDQSGWSVSLCDDGTVVAIGAPRNAGNGSTSGHVRVYRNESKRGRISL